MTGVLSDLGSVLERGLTAYFGRPSVVTALRHRPYVYSTSFALEELDVSLQDGTSLQLILKDLGVAAMLPDARVSKPAFLYEPRREIETYARILSRTRLGTPTCYGTVVDDDHNRYWLFLEKVPGLELYQMGDTEVWQHVAAWLAAMHSCTSLDADTVRHANRHLIRYDADFYRRWFDRARTFIGPDGPRQRRALTVVGQGLETALGRLAELPDTFVHGEFYASNVLVAEAPTGRRICPVDWEMAGVGPGLVDLAALCAGWDDESRRLIAHSYHLACGDGAAWPDDEEDFLVLLRDCQLCLAVQWLGWAPAWAAPPEHARDWLGEATQLAERIVL